MINRETGEALVEFPCRFHFKITGKNTPEFKPKIIQLLQKIDDNLQDSNIRETHSSTQKYLSLTVYLYCNEQSDIDRAYALLKSEPLVLWAL